MKNPIEKNQTELDIQAGDSVKTEKKMEAPPTESPARPAGGFRRGKVVSTGTTSEQAKESEARLAELEEAKKEEEAKRIEEEAKGIEKDEERRKAREKRKRTEKRKEEPPSEVLKGIDFTPLVEVSLSLVSSLGGRFLRPDPPTKEEKKMIATGLEMTLSRHGESAARWAPYLFLSAGVAMFALARFKMPEKRERPQAPPVDEQEQFIRPDLIPRML
jgi:hypothetical protein